MFNKKIIDAHHHLWDLGYCNYPWLNQKGVRRFFGDPTPIQKNYLIQDFLDDSRNFELTGSVHIQVGVSHEHNLRETEWVQSLADAPHRLPAAIVAHTDLTDPKLKTTLDAHSTHSNFRGIRQIIGRHPSEDKNTGTDELIDDPRFLEGLRTLADRDLTFDLQLTPLQYMGVAQLLEQVPTLKVAICHFASPWGLLNAGTEIWEVAMSKFAKFPNVFLKFSGFGMFKSDWADKDIAPFIKIALRQFGSHRLMAGSNFPVDKLYGTYDRIWNSLEKILPDTDTYSRVTRDNAATFYDISI